MAQMHELTLFCGVIHRKGLFSVKGLYLFDVAPTKEIEWPYRISKRSIQIRLPRGKALCIGRWSFSGMSETEALLSALEGINLGFQGQGITASVKEVTED